MGILLEASQNINAPDHFMDGRIESEVYQKIQLLEIIKLMLSCLGIALCWLSVINLSLNSRKYNLEFEEKIGTKNEEILYMNLFLSFTCSILIIAREKYGLKLKKMQGHINERENLISSEAYKTIFQELLITFLHPYPFLLGYKIQFFNRQTNFYIYYHYNDFLSLLLLIKKIYIFNSVLQLTEWKSSSSQRIWYINFLKLIVRCMAVRLVHYLRQEP